jgi:predicted O-methyltransferase YrrM
VRYDGSFETVWPLADEAAGWLTRDQGLLLHSSAAALRPDATIVEIGSYEGRSTLVLAAGLGPEGAVVAIDPWVEDWKFGAAGTRDRFTQHLRDAGLTDRVRVVAERSQRVRPGWRAPIDLLFIDGKHDVWSFSDDLRWSRHCPPGSLVLVHDCFSSIGVTLGVLGHVLPSRHLTYLDRVGSLARFHVRRPSARDRLRIVREIPWWLRNVVVKVALRLRLAGVSRALGHDGAADPY